MNSEQARRAEGLTKLLVLTYDGNKVKVLEGLKSRQIQWVVLIVLLGGVVAGVVLVQQRQLFQKRAAGENASMSLPAQMTAQVGQQVEVPIYVNTDGADVAGIDVVLNFDKAKLRLTNIDPRAATTTTLKTFAPVTSNGGFDENRVISQANQAGKIEFGAVSFDWQSDALTGPFNGVMGTSNPLAMLTFEALAAGQTGVTFGFTAGQTTDSNLARLDTATDILAAVTNLTLNITTTGVTATPTGQALRGDIQPAPNGDGDVDIFDYNVLVGNFGATNACGNAADIQPVGGDCDVDIFDYNVLVGDFGKQL